MNKRHWTEVGSGGWRPYEVVPRVWVATTAQTEREGSNDGNKTVNYKRLANSGGRVTLKVTQWASGRLGMP